MVQKKLRRETRLLANMKIPWEVEQASVETVQPSDQDLHKVFLRWSSVQRKLGHDDIEADESCRPYKRSYSHSGESILRKISISPDFSSFTNTKQRKGRERSVSCPIAPRTVLPRRRLNTDFDQIIRDISDDSLYLRFKNHQSGSRDTNNNSFTTFINNCTSPPTSLTSNSSTELKAITSSEDDIWTDISLENDSEQVDLYKKSLACSAAQSACLITQPICSASVSEQTKKTEASEQKEYWKFTQDVYRTLTEEDSGTHNQPLSEIDLSDNANQDDDHPNQTRSEESFHSILLTDHSIGDQSNGYDHRDLTEQSNYNLDPDVEANYSIDNSYCSFDHSDRNIDQLGRKKHLDRSIDQVDRGIDHPDRCIDYLKRSFAYSDRNFDCSERKDHSDRSLDHPDRCADRSVSVQDQDDKSKLMDELLQDIYPKNGYRSKSPARRKSDETFLAKKIKGRKKLVRFHSESSRFDSHNDSFYVLTEESRSRLSQLSYHDLSQKCNWELVCYVEEMRSEILEYGKRLVMELETREFETTRLQESCDVITAYLQSQSEKRSEDTQMKFTVEPGPGDTGFTEWATAMKMVARLPEGVPQHFRKTLWLTLAEKHLTSRGVTWSQTERSLFSDVCNPDDEELSVQIVKDLHRTGCSLFCGVSGQHNQAVLKRVLLAFARWNKHVGYCQGLNMLAALILQVMQGSQTSTVKVMIYLIEGVLPESYFGQNLRGLSVDMAVFRDLLRLKLPHLSKHLDQLQHDSKESGTSYEPPLMDVFTMQWFLTIFCNCLPQPTVLRVWDLLFLEGNEVLLKTALAIWQYFSDRILAVKSADEFYSSMAVYTREILELGLLDPNSLIRAIDTLSIPEVGELREKYVYNITPWTVATVAKKGLRLLYDPYDSDDEQHQNNWSDSGGSEGNRSSRGSSSDIKMTPFSNHPDREKIALDISVLKKQYMKLRERQRQAHIIFTAACSSDNLGSTTSPALNHLLLGKSALLSMKGRRIQGTIPSTYQHNSNNRKSLSSNKVEISGETLHWRDTGEESTGRQGNQRQSRTRYRNKITFNNQDETDDMRSRSSSSSSGSSSSSTELCDDSTDSCCDESLRDDNHPENALQHDLERVSESDQHDLERSNDGLDVRPDERTDDLPDVLTPTTDSSQTLTLTATDTEEERVTAMGSTSTICNVEPQQDIQDIEEDLATETYSCQIDQELESGGVKRRNSERALMQILKENSEILRRIQSQSAIRTQGSITEMDDVHSVSSPVSPLLSPYGDCEEHTEKDDIIRELKLEVYRNSIRSLDRDIGEPDDIAEIRRKYSMNKQWSLDAVSTSNRKIFNTDAPDKPKSFDMASSGGKLSPSKPFSPFPVRSPRKKSALGVQLGLYSPDEVSS